MIVGIDLGTSNCAVAWADPAHDASAQVNDFAIVQLQHAGEAAARPLLPSFLYLPAPGELSDSATTLPWRTTPGRIVGEFARWQGARVPGRLISSAKSWLCHATVDRTAEILPWGAPPDVVKLSPVSASADYLRHIAAAWNHANPRLPLEQQEVIVTVPASFDEAARSLTVRAAREAGLERFTLIEEPEAAFYDFTAQHRSNLAATLENVRLVLVVDVGGGTTDFSLVRASVVDRVVALERIAVGDHLMLGGDNMDAALARRAEEQFATRTKLETTQWTQLIQAARGAKESLLSDDGPLSVRLAVARSGSKLFGNTLSAELRRDDVQKLVLDGFFPFCGAGDTASRGSRAALQELGLPYAQDPAITRHLAEFLRRHSDAAHAALGSKRGGTLPRPDAMLLNGGVFNAARLAQRLVEVMSAWWPEESPIRVLPHTSLDLAVARGAAYYGLVRHGLGLKISGGAAHALFVGLGTSSSAEPQAICVIPRGHEQGEVIELKDRPFQLALGKPVQFPLYSSASDARHRAGAIVPITSEFTALPPIHTLLKGRSGAPAPVFLRSTLTEIGTLELACVSTDTNEQWRLEFELRGSSGDTGLVTMQSMPARYSEAKQAIEFIYSAKAKPAKQVPPGMPKDVKQLWASLERALGPRAQWTLPVLRELWTSLFAGAPRRRRSAEQERVYFQLLGFVLRPGFGYPLDEWRCSETFSLFPQAVEFHKEKPNWNEFWVLWRRVTPGLTEDQQRQLFEYQRPHLLYRFGTAKNAARPKGIQVEGFDEMLKVAASLELLSLEAKIEVAELALRGLMSPETSRSGPWPWVLGRIGARVPVRGSIHKVVGPEIASRWIDVLLSDELSGLDGVAFALTQLARLTGDRVRDINPVLRERVINTLAAMNAPPQWKKHLQEAGALDAADEARVLGDTLPPGLQLIDKER